MMVGKEMAAAGLGAKGSGQVGNKYSKPTSLRREAAPEWQALQPFAIALFSDEGFFCGNTIVWRPTRARPHQNGAA